MKPAGGSGAIPALARAERSSAVSGQSRWAATISTAQPTAATCSTSVRRNRQASSPPNST